MKYPFAQPALSVQSRKFSVTLTTTFTTLVRSVYYISAGSRGQHCIVWQVVPSHAKINPRWMRTEHEKCKIGFWGVNQTSFSVKSVIICYLCVPWHLGLRLSIHGWWLDTSLVTHWEWKFHSCFPKYMMHCRNTCILCKGAYPSDLCEESTLENVLTLKLVIYALW